MPEIRVTSHTTLAVGVLKELVAVAKAYEMARATDDPGAWAYAES